MSVQASRTRWSRISLPGTRSVTFSKCSVAFLFLSIIYDNLLSLLNFFYWKLILLFMPEYDAFICPSSCFFLPLLHYSEQNICILLHLLTKYLPPQIHNKLKDGWIDPGKRKNMKRERLCFLYGDAAG